MNSHFQKHWRIWLVLAGPVLFFIFYFAQNQFFSSFDTMDFYYVVKRWYWDKIWSGEFPYWNDGIYGGIYQLASPPIGIFSPFTALFFSLFPNILAEQLQLPLFGALGGLGFFLLARRLSGLADVGLILGVAYGLSGPMLSLVDRSHIFYAAALYPWAMWSFLRLEISAAKRDALALSTSLALILIYSDWTAAMGLVALFSGWTLFAKASRRARAYLGLSILLTFGLAAAAILPTFENLSETVRASGLPFELASVFSLHPWRALNLVLPEMWGQPYSQTFWGQHLTTAATTKRFWFHSLFLGLPVLLSGAVGLLALRESKRWLFLALVAVACLLISLGSHFELHGFLFENIGLYRSLRYPEKFIFYFLFAWMVFSALGFKKIFHAQRLAYLWSALALAHLALFVSTFYIYPSGDSLVSTYGLTAGAAGSVVENLELSRWLHLAFSGAAGLGLLSCLWLRRISPALCVALFTAFELLGAAPAQLVAPWGAFTERSPFLSQLQSSHGRILRDPLLDDLVSDRNAVTKTLQSNWPMLFQLRQVFGYDPVKSPRVLKLLDLEIYQHLDVWSRVFDITHVVTSITPRATLIDLWLTQGLLKSSGVDPSTNMAVMNVARAEAPYEMFSEYVVAHDENEALRRTYERGLNAEPAILEGDVPKVPMEKRGTEDLQKSVILADVHAYRVQTSAAVVFVERAGYHPAWHAYLDGHSVPIFRADYVSRAVLLPSGTHDLEFKFEPALFPWAAAVSLLSLLIYFGLWAHEAYHYRVSRSASSSLGGRAPAR